ncbi:MAG TPA: ATP-dependent Clp protease proteolytic subunit [Planctomycetota bacterium]|nr:ATP-dependent Clp protease proteolytic subunit [Planctomycetota bacterium]
MSNWRDPNPLPKWPLIANDDDDDDDDDDEEEKKSRQGGLAALGLDLLRKGRSIIISEPVTPKLTQRVLASLLWLDADSSDPIKIFINTPGGSADDGFAIYDIIRFVRAPVYNITLGLNASAGILVLLSVPKERRLALPSTRLMMHQPSGGGRGTASDIEITASEIMKLREKANVLISEQTGQPLEKVETDTDRDFWLSAQEALDYGLVGRIVERIDNLGI